MEAREGFRKQPARPPGPDEENDDNWRADLLGNTPQEQEKNVAEDGGVVVVGNAKTICVVQEDYDGSCFHQVEVHPWATQQ